MCGQTKDTAFKRQGAFVHVESLLGSWKWSGVGGISGKGSATCSLSPLPFLVSRPTHLSISDGCAIHQSEDMKSGESPLPQLFLGLLQETGPLLRKQSRPRFLLGQREREELGRASDAFLRSRDQTQITEEDAGRAEVGVREEEPFPSQLRLHFLCWEEVPGWGAR